MWAGQIQRFRPYTPRLVRFYSCSDQILIRFQLEFFTTFNVCGCSDIQKIWTCQSFGQKINFFIFMANFAKNGHFLVRNDLRSGLVLVSRVSLMCLLKKQTRPDRNPDPKIWPFFTILAVKNFNSYFLVKVLTCPNSLDIRASTDIERVQKFQLEPDQNPIGT